MDNTATRMNYRSQKSEGRENRCQLKTKKLINLAFTRNLDPPKSPLRRGTLRVLPVPPFLRGVRGDLDLIVKQQSVTTTVNCQLSTHYFLSLAERFDRTYRMFGNCIYFLYSIKPANAKSN